MNDEILKGLNKMQLKAVTHTEGPLLVLAGAGSGKTRVITYRIANLIENLGVSPWSILAITFTNKAAAEMRDRLIKLVGEQAEDMWIRTFHSACVRILRHDIDKLGYDTSFTIYDSDDQKRLIKDCLKELNFDEKMYPVSSCISHISSAKDEFVSCDEFDDIYKGNLKMLAIGKVYSLYQKRLRKCNAVDFDDLIVLTVKLFEEHPDVLNYYSNKFRYIHIDEYQDTNNAQYRFVSLLAEKYKNLCVVGDDDQSIYKFRGANINNILDFEKTFPQAEVIRLEQNYRSTGTILDAANNVISHNVGRKGKTLWTDNGSGIPISKYRAENERDEAGFISDEIRRLHQSDGIAYSDIAVLYRMNAQSRALEERLINAAVPYKIIAGHRFYDRKEIRDIIAYLRVINNPRDDVSLVRIINEPKRKIGKTTVDNAASLASERGLSIYELLSSDLSVSKPGSPTSMFIEMMDSLRADAEGTLVSSFITDVLSKTGYASQYKALPNDIEAAGRLENLSEFISVAVNYEKENEEPTLADFLDNISLISDIDTYDEEQDMVSLLTLHSAKGLEFPVVFLCGLEESVFPSQRAMFEREEVEEERRLCYVGITRAQKMLYMTHAAERMLFGSTTYNKVSRFLTEIPEELYNDLTPATPKAQNIVTAPSGSSNITFSSTLTGTPKPPKPQTDCNYKAGDVVRHKKFGQGIILSAVPVGNDVKLEIAFDGVGTKTLLAVYANLTLVS